jgi:hypothetical protein
MGDRGVEVHVVLLWGIGLRFLVGMGVAHGVFVPLMTHRKPRQLQGAILYGAQLEGASFRHAQLQGALLDGVMLDGAALDGAAVYGTTCERGYRFYECTKLHDEITKTHHASVWTGRHLQRFVSADGKPFQVILAAPWHFARYVNGTVGQIFDERRELT